MERNANYALVGLISTILLIAMIVFILWLTNFALSTRYDTYDVVFHGPVSGLSRGGDVQFNGIKVGEVQDIKLDATDPNLVHAYARVRSDPPVRQDSSASLEPHGLTGVNYVQITAGGRGKPLLKDVTPFGQPLQIIASGSTISSLLSGGGNVMQQAVGTLGRINRVLSDDNIKKFSTIIADVQAVTTELRERKAIIGDADQTLKNAGEAATQIRDLAKSAQGLLNDKGKDTFAKIDATADQIQGLASDARSMIAKLQGPTSDFASTGLPKLTSTIDSLQTAMQNLNRLVEEVERDPRSFVAKAPAKQIEVKP